MGGSFYRVLLLFDFRVDLILENLGGLKHGGVARGDVDRLAVGRVAALASVAMLAGEAAEAEERDRLARGEGVHDGIEHAIHNGCRLLLGQFIFRRDLFDQFCFVHSDYSPLSVLFAVSDRIAAVSMRLVLNNVFLYTLTHDRI